ncbi:TonB-dependent receptor [Haliea sp. E1-2-M8]|uniref:TonB-dependent receptor n=1 Tax=Haliea sp. E1-2-M8 TaxID=3064706 RepID=UPI00272875D6|nr:TonB-dependent receptor [Haliea sp. E1-2-M8]MDO8864095.1 TonB-dependent receptor [Haliea sp. E1-2-M8]
MPRFTSSSIKLNVLRLTLPCLSGVVGLSAHAELMLEEVVVSARKKGNAEALQEVPVAITAVSGDMIEQRFFNDLTDLGNIAPNVSLSPVGSMPGTANFFIRGMGVFGSIPSDETTVGVIQDGIYLGVNSGALTNLFDVEAVEVLRGPQGTLFGRNVTGGAVVVNSRRPSADFGGSVRGRAGNFGKYSVDGAVGGSLNEQQSVLGRIAAGYQTNDDYFDNIAGPDRGEGRTRYFRPSVSFHPNSDLSVTLIGEYNQFEGDGVISKNVALTDILDDHQLATDIDGKAEYEVKHLIADVDWSLGGGDLKIIAGWRDTDVEGELDGDGQPNPVPKVHSNDPWKTVQDQVSLEVRYNKQVSAAAELTMGLYYFDQDIEYIESRTLNLGAPVDNNVGAGSVLDHSSYAVFAQTDIAIADNWSLTVGGRYTSEDKDAKIASFGLCDGVGLNCSYDFADEDSWSFVSANLALKWQISDSAQAYSSWTRSFRSGGYNLRNTRPSIPGPYDEEQVDALELGFKSDLVGGRVRLNAAVFHNEFTDLQRTIVISDPSSGVRQDKVNAADATIQGIELELSAIISQNFRVDLSGGLIDAQYDKFVGGNTDWDLPNVPKTNGNLTLVYNQTMGEGELETRLSATYTDSQHTTVENTPIIELDSYTVVDGAISYWFPGEALRLSLFGKNLTDEEYTNFALAGLNAIWAISPPRTYGVEISYSF